MSIIERIILTVFMLAFFAVTWLMIWIGSVSMRAESAASYQHHFMLSTEE